MSRIASSTSPTSTPLSGPTGTGVVALVLLGPGIATRGGTLLGTLAPARIDPGSNRLLVGMPPVSPKPTPI